MGRMAMKLLVVLALGTSYWSCSGFPVYDYDPASLREALRASVAKVNSQSLSPHLFRAFRSSLKRVEVLDESNLIMSLEFSVRETTCGRDSGEDPSTCPFQGSYFSPTAVCRSAVQVSAEQVRAVRARCSWAAASSASASESLSSEEMIFRDMLGSHTWRNNYPFGLVSDESRIGQFYDRSLEIMRRVLPPGNRRYPNYRHRARINAGLE
uniref:Secreted phosphoprotein 24 n=1 Tax=Microcebus murinus TaxID=30608 RepID=A0A8C5XYF7_MICMU|nr:secreted phosphoprotein 24 isoform X2 [Microcebus murinus]XP_012608754.1 secreted phosphoprotein 24 isoform X2 [Microcebus murinus]